MFSWTWWPRGKMLMCLPWRQRAWCLFWLLLGIQGSTTRSQGNEICFSPHANWQNLHLTYEDGAKKNNLEGIGFLDFQRGGERGDVGIESGTYQTLLFRDLQICHAMLSHTDSDGTQECCSEDALQGPDCFGSLGGFYTWSFCCDFGRTKIAASREFFFLGI